MKFLKLTKRFGIGFSANVDTSTWYLNPSFLYRKEWHITDNLKCLWLRWLVFGVGLKLIDLTKYSTTVQKAEESLAKPDPVKKPEKIRVVSKPVVAPAPKPVAKKTSTKKVGEKKVVKKAEKISDKKKKK